MAFDLSSIGSSISGWIISPLIWIMILFVFITLTFGIMIIRKRRKLIYTCIEIVDHGTGKVNFNELRCGWFGKKKFLGVWDYGEEQLETKTGEIIYDFSTEDFHEFNGKRCVFAFRDPINQNILVPISKVLIKNRELLNEIAPANFRDVAIEIIRDVKQETSDWKEKMIQYVIFGVVIIFALVSIILIVQMVKSGQDKASKLILDAGDLCLQSAKSVCSEIALKSTAP